MNPMYVDPYIRLSHNRHWLTNNAKKKSKHNKSQATASTPALIKKKSRHLQHENKFNPEVIDTFCFHWPDMHSYVLVRVLESTIAILPVRSRLAFLYFHHAPLPAHPSPQDLRKALRPVAAAHGSSKRIHDMFKSWKHTLVIDEEKLEEGEEKVDIGDANAEHEEEDVFANKSDSNSSSDDNNNTNTNNTSSSTFNKVTETPPSTPKVHSSVTLSDVLSYERNLRSGWIHAPCTVTDDENIFDNNVILTTKHTELKLTARCFSEKMMFMNLVKLQHSTLDAENTNLTVNKDSDIDDDDKSAHLTTRRLSSKSNSTTIGV